MLTKKLFQTILILSMFPLVLFGQNSTTKSTSLNQFGALEKHLRHFQLKQQVWN